MMNSKIPPLLSFRSVMIVSLNPTLPEGPCRRQAPQWRRQLPGADADRQRQVAVLPAVGAEARPSRRPDRPALCRAGTAPHAALPAKPRSRPPWLRPAHGRSRCLTGSRLVTAEMQILVSD